MKFKLFLLLGIVGAIVFYVNQSKVVSELPDIPKLHSKQALLLHVNSGKLLLEQGGDEKIYPASLTKIMTAILAIEYFDDLDVDYKKLRCDLLNIVPKPIEKNYEFDLEFGIRIYEYFNNVESLNFNEAVASNYDFWRYICLKVIPDVIEKRHGFVETYYYSKNVRMYIPTLWWYIEIGYQGDIKSTYNCLKSFSTDYIVQFVERPGREGLYIEVIRRIFYYLAKLPKEVINDKKGNQTLIRRLLIQHTAKNANYNLVVEGKIDEYVKELYKSCGVEV